MKIKISISLTAVLICALQAGAQVGVGTTTPNSMLDVRGSLSLNYRAITASTTASIADNMLVITGTTAATITLPDATACIGRIYCLKVPAQVLRYSLLPLQRRRQLKDLAAG